MIELDLPLFRTLAVRMVAMSTPAASAFHYCMTLILVEKGLVHIVSVIPGQNGDLYTFETVNGDRFSLVQPLLTAEGEAAIKNAITLILEGKLIMNGNRDEVDEDEEDELENWGGGRWPM